MKAILKGGACIVGGLIVGLAILHLQPRPQHFIEVLREQPATGNVDDRRLPAVQNWIRHKPELIPQAWSIPDDEQSDLFTSFAAKGGATAAGWVHPTTRSLPLEISSNSPRPDAPGFTQFEISGEMQTIPRWMAVEMLKRELAR